MKTLFIIALMTFTCAAHTQDWSREASLPGVGKFSPHHRADIYEQGTRSMEAALLRGRGYALNYPVSVTELMIPYESFLAFFNTDPQNPLKRLIFRASKKITRMESPDDVMNWLGIHDYPTTSAEQGPGPWPVMERELVDLGMGASLITQAGAQGLTFSCAACHSADLFGKKVLGLTNRFPRANEFFRAGKRLLPFAHPVLFKAMTGASDADVKMLERSRYAVQFVGAKKPQVLGLDTSLAQVALSLARRDTDEYAARNPRIARNPRSNPLEKKIADSKPAVWWNVKYKTRWLSDGSIVQGNPIHTNFLWNEIGRGIDLKSLEGWLNQNQDVINDLTASVFATPAPEFLDFLPEKMIKIDLAKKGEVHFNNHCMRCHGQYQKAWSLPEAETLSLKEQIRTIEVAYHRKTPVIDVGTDPGRYEGMKYFAEELNRLKISRSINTIVEPQKGYVPPPLVGIWARWPYFHNNSAPNLCAVLTAGKNRPETYWAGAALNPETDYDPDCGGYPVGAKTPEAWKKDQSKFYDTRREGLSRLGHDEKIFIKDGQEVMTPQEKKELIEFLKTL